LIEEVLPDSAEGRLDDWLIAGWDQPTSTMQQPVVKENSIHVVGP